MDDVIYRGELEALAAEREGFELAYTLTRQRPAGWTGYTRRVDAQMIGECLERLGGARTAYVCGPTAFVETAASALVAAGMPPDAVRTERFGPSGT